MLLLIFPGFSDGGGGSYDGSNTWFEVVMVNSVGHDLGPRKVFQYNIVASLEFRRHEIRWDFDKVDKNLQSWLNTLQAGDAIRIVPKAQYPGWVNFVQEAEIELHFIEGPPRDMMPVLPVSELVISEVSELESHVFRKLNEDLKEIRLVLLNPGSVEEPISCSLVYTSLNSSEDIAYDALSYCWGDSKEKCNILFTTSGQEDLGKPVLSITLSLHSALKSLRTESGPPRMLWIDAICIDQENLIERSQQVAFMKNIYSRAENVIIWLGDGDEVTSKCISTIKTVGDRYALQSSDAGSEKKSKKEMHDPLLATHSSYHWFLNEFPLFDMPWFRRTWVIQEVFNAKNATVRCGQDTLAWSMILRVNQCMCILRSWKTSVYKGVLPPLFSDLLNLHQTEGSNARSAGLGILEVLVKGLDLDATDPRDKIFAMLQFGEDIKQSELLPADIRPDYEKATAQVYSDFTRWWIIAHKSLRILSAVHAETGRTWQKTLSTSNIEQVEGRPTWSLWYKGHSNYAEGILGLSADTHYCAADDTVPDLDMISESQGSLSLPLAGHRVSIIQNIKAYPYYAVHPNHPELYSELHNAYTSIFDPLNETDKWTDSIYSQKNEHVIVAGNRKEQWARHYHTHAEFSRNTSAVECHSECFLETTDGIWGLCPYFARGGDLIVILYGGNVPYILRQKEGPEETDKSSPRYEFIGECYLSGYMEGRSMRKQQKQDIRREVFTLV